MLCLPDYMFQCSGGGRRCFVALLSNSAGGARGGGAAAEKSAETARWRLFMQSHEPSRGARFVREPARRAARTQEAQSSATLCGRQVKKNRERCYAQKQDRAQVPALSRSMPSCAHEAARPSKCLLFCENAGGGENAQRRSSPRASSRVFVRVIESALEKTQVCHAQNLDKRRVTL